MDVYDCSIFWFLCLLFLKLKIDWNVKDLVEYGFRIKINVFKGIDWKL